jgi:Uma2 family endonuclease
MSEAYSTGDVSRYYRHMVPRPLVCVEEYLRSTDKPNCDYIDGVLYEKAWANRNHGVIQGYVACLIMHCPGFEVGIEVTVQIRPGKYLVPDLAVQDRDHIQKPYPTEPVHLCVEILSPEDRIGAVFTKCEDYHAWGVETVWIVDPENPRAWEFRKGRRPVEVPLTGSLTAPGISISLPDLFSAVS